MEQSGHTESELLDCVYLILEKLKKCMSEEYQVAYRQYSAGKHEGVAVSMYRFMLQKDLI